MSSTLSSWPFIRAATIRATSAVPKPFTMRVARRTAWRLVLPVLERAACTREFEACFNLPAAKIVDKWKTKPII
jgi:hypothetical protein